MARTMYASISRNIKHTTNKAFMPSVQGKVTPRNVTVDFTTFSQRLATLHFEVHLQALKKCPLVVSHLNSFVNRHN